MKKTLIAFSLVLMMSAPALLEINAYKYDSSLLNEGSASTIIVSPSLRHN